MTKIFDFINHKKYIIIDTKLILKTWNQKEAEEEYEKNLQKRA